MWAQESGGFIARGIVSLVEPVFASSVQASSVFNRTKVHCYVHKIPSLHPILSQMNPIHTPPSYIRPILTLSSHAGIVTDLTILSLREKRREERREERRGEERRGEERRGEERREEKRKWG
jgi:hypothetical protein